MATQRKPQKKSASRKSGSPQNVVPSTHTSDVPHPRPQLVRNTGSWGHLNGRWDFEIDPQGKLTHPSEVQYTRTINVPYSPETPASGVNEQGFFKSVWYRREWVPPKVKEGERLWLRFGAVDYIARVFINGAPVGTHEGGYSPFGFDVTEFVKGQTPLEVVVWGEDDPHDMAKPRGKQDWLERPHSIWYARTTGIWQSVWWEIVPDRWIDKLRWYADGLTFQVGFVVKLGGVVTEGQRVRIRLSHRGKTLGETITTTSGTGAAGTVTLPDPGIGDARNDLYWYPWSPKIIDAEVALIDGDRTIDQVSSYTALRHIKLEGGRFWLNGAPIRLDLVLDQGYWLESGLTPPGDAAIRKDVELVKAMGFNGVRKHQKLEDPRFLYWADHLGLLVWSEFPGCYRFSPEAVVRTTAQWMEAIERDVSHPCIIAWVPFNESWGVPDLPDDPAQRALVDGIYHLTKAFDPSRPVVGNDGWELCKTDIVAVHDYDADPARIVRRYVNLEQFMEHEKPGFKMLALEGYSYAGCPFLLTEFGGIAFSRDYEGTWGYSRARSEQDLAKRYTRLMEAVRSIPILGGFCYTQLTDTYQEANGLLYMDRTPKFDLHLMNIATRGARDDREWEVIRGVLDT